MANPVQQSSLLQPPAFLPPSGAPGLGQTLPPEIQQALGLSPAPHPLAVAPTGQPQQAKPTAAIAAPTAGPTPVTLPGISPRVKQAQAAEDALRAQGGPQYTGKLGLLEKVGDVAGRLLAPGIEQRLGIGTLGYEGRLAKAEGATQEAEKEAASDTGAQKNEADAGLTQANAEKAQQNLPANEFELWLRQNPNAPATDFLKAQNEAKPQTPEEQVLNYLTRPEAQGGKGMTPDEALKTIQAASKAPSLQHVTVLGPGGTPVAATFDPQTGAYRNSAGALIPNPQPYTPTGSNVANEIVTAIAGPLPKTNVWNGKTYPTTEAAQAAWGQAANAARNAGSFGEQYMKIRTLQELINQAYSHNPALLGPAQHLAQTLNLGFSPSDISSIGTIPAGQPENEAGTPIGLAQPGAPTNTTRTAGQVAQRVIAELPRVRSEIGTLAPQLGPVFGRWNDFMTGKIGSGDPAFEQLRTDVQFVNAAAARFHLNSVEAVKEFNALASAGKMTAPVLDAYLNAVQDWAKTAAQQGEGRPIAQSGDKTVTQAELAAVAKSTYGGDLKKAEAAAKAQGYTIHE